MQIVVNDEPVTYDGKATLDGLIESLKIPAARVAVMLNDEVITKECRSRQLVKENDRVEILTFAGGG